MGNSSSRISNMSDIIDDPNKPTLIKLLETFPNKPWSLYTLAENPNLTIEYMLPYLEREIGDSKMWIWQGLLLNPNLTIQHVLNNENSANPQHTIWRYVSQNLGIKLCDIEDHPELPWDWEFVARNPNITLEFIFKYQDKFKETNYMNLGGTKHITIQDIKTYPAIFWNKLTLSNNPNLTLDFVLDDVGDLNNYWNWINIMKCPNIKVQDVLKFNKDHPNVFKNVYSDIMSGLSANTTITIDIVRENFTHKWNWREISKNPVFTLDEIYELTKFAQDEFICNPNITFDWIMNHQGKEIVWGRDGLSCNTFLWHPYFTNDPITIRI